MCSRERARLFPFQTVRVGSRADLLGDGGAASAHHSGPTCGAGVGGQARPVGRALGLSGMRFPRPLYPLWLRLQLFQDGGLCSLAAGRSGHCTESSVRWATADLCLPRHPGPAPEAAQHTRRGPRPRDAVCPSNPYSALPFARPGVAGRDASWFSCLVPGVWQTHPTMDPDSFLGWASVESPLSPLGTCLPKAPSAFSGLLLSHAALPVQKASVGLFSSKKASSLLVILSLLFFQPPSSGGRGRSPVRARAACPVLSAVVGIQDTVLSSLLQ